MSGDSSQRVIIFNVTEISGGGWPNGLTIDYDSGNKETNPLSGRIYWIDAK